MIDLLVDRLRWPAALVRERAASQIGKLIAEGDQVAKDALVAWIARQDLESLAAVGLLPFISAAASPGSNPPPTAELASACMARSPLSELYLSHLDPSYASQPDLGRHSETPPNNRELFNEVSEGPTSDLQASLRNRLKILEVEFLKSLTRQFDFEMFKLGERYGRLSVEAYRAAGTRERGYHPGWDPLGNQISLSAYLRTLAWAASNKALPNDFILKEAAVVSPIDLGLWSVRPTTSPDWWPTLDPSSDQGEIDKETVSLIQKVEISAKSWDSGSNVVLAASGNLHNTNLRQHNLEIRSFFQRPDGPDRPTGQDLFEFLSSVRASIHQESSPLRFEGAVSTSIVYQQLSDWLIIPCSGGANPLVPIIWQAWRGVRGIQCPSTAIADSQILAVCHQDSIHFETEEALIARWSDWSQGVSALFVEDLPPATGSILVAPRSVVDRFSEATGMKLAWAWELTSHFREHSYLKFTVHRMYFDHGTSRVIRP